MSEIYCALFIFLIVILETTSKDPLGCGGFVKSHVAIDFSKVEVKLLTKQGILKDRITCAPNNGYYFVPIYDKGEYILELQPPPGWSFTPIKVSLSIDGSTDQCSQGKDIDFVFKGFGITGKVQSLGDVAGPEGVEVELRSKAGTRKTITSSGGNFFFTPVFPGTYTVAISKSKWQVAKQSVDVIVTEGNTALRDNSLLIQGYDVTGAVVNEGLPIKNTTVLLFSTDQRNNIQIDGCSKELISNSHLKKQPICHVKSNDKGTFTFGTVPLGRYYISLFYDGHNIFYQPQKIEFTVQHDSVQLKENFEIIGFSVLGRVLKSTSGPPIKNAKIYLNGDKTAQTDSNGFYKIEKIKAGTYNFKAEIGGFQFKEVPFKINPNSEQLPDLIPFAQEVCGNVLSEKSQTITFSQIGSTKFITTNSDVGTGNFCEFLTPGRYQVQVIVNSDDSQKGLQFYPKSQIIEVNSNQVYDISFSQLKATVKGKVKCIDKKDCADLKVVLRPSGEETDNNDVVINVFEFNYEVSDVYPGSYDISIVGNKLCWNPNKQVINVNIANIEVPTFVQTGYTIIFESFHEDKIIYQRVGQTDTKTIKIIKGKQPHCLEKAGIYNFELKGCHNYESNKFSFDTETASNEIKLSPRKHKVSLTIEGEQRGDVDVIINIDGTKTKIGPLTYNNGYLIEVFLAPWEKSIIIPQSEVLYFTPPLLAISGSNDCIHLGNQFIGVLGVVYKGRITPPLSGVVITVEDQNHETIMAESDAAGFYKFSPLDNSKNYKIYAKKDFYVFKGPDSDGNFLAHKLAEISIEVVDKDDDIPLVGTLLSLSGGESYRSNLQTGQDGKITFNSLSPGEYFLRPMMKEYSFEPNSKIISVQEGQTVNVKLTGKKVAYSVFGEVISLNGEPEENLIVVAQGVRNCSHFSEESTSESNGKFRIRGLQPYCSYSINVKNDLENKVLIERSAPNSITVEKIVKDIKHLKIVIFRPVANMDVLVRVYANNVEHYKILRIRLIRESAPSEVFYTGRIDTSSITLTPEYNRGALIQIPQIPANGKSYSIQLESVNQNIKWDVEPDYFTTNTSFKYFEYNLNVKRNIVDHDIKQISLKTVILIVCLLLALYKIDKIVDLVRVKFGHYLPELNSVGFNKKVEKDYPMDNDDIDQIVQSINAVKRKPKPKKA